MNKVHGSALLVMNVNRTNRGFAIRFFGFGFLMAIANISPYLLTRGAYATDGHEIAGFPLRCYDFGGFSGMIVFNPWAMIANIMIAVFAAALGACLFQDGILVTLRHWQVWGTPNARPPTDEQ